MTEDEAPMKVTPLDLRQQRFKTAIRGFDRAEVTAFLSIALLCMGLIFGPMGAVLSELFPTQVRYTGASLAFNFAGIIGASPHCDPLPGRGGPCRGK